MKNGMYSIGEICRLCEITSSKLRYYDELGIIKPAFIDNESGYRYYDGEATVLISTVKYYQSCGFKLKEIQEMLKVKEAGQLRDPFEARIRELEEEITALQIQRDSISAWNDLVKEQLMVKTMSEIPIYHKHFDSGEMYVTTPYVWDELQYEALVADINLFNHLEYCGYATVGPFFIHFPNGDRSKLSDVEVFIKPHPLSDDDAPRRYMEGFDALCTYHLGAPATCHETHDKIKAYADLCGIKLRGDCFERSVVDRWSTDNEDEYLLEIIFPRA